MDSRVRNTANLKKFIALVNLSAQALTNLYAFAGFARVIRKFPGLESVITRRSLCLASLGLAVAAQARAHGHMPAAPDIPFATWSDDEPLYTFFPGDKVEVQVPAAPELNRQTQVGPDGRITLPLIGQVMAAYRTVPDLQADIRARYADGVLLDPGVEVFPGDTTPMQVLVGGEVKNPGPVAMTGDMDTLQAVFAAGGFLSSAKRERVMIIRRGRNGGAMQRIVDLKDPLKGKASDMVALRRLDIVYVPRTNVAVAGEWVNAWINTLIPGGVLNYFSYRTFN